MFRAILAFFLGFALSQQPPPPAVCPPRSNNYVFYLDRSGFPGLSDAQIQVQVRPFLTYLDQKIGVQYGKNFTSFLGTREEFRDQVLCEAIDFAFINPLTVSCTASDLGGSIVTTALRSVTLQDGHSQTTMFDGGIIFVRADSDIRMVEDLVGRSIVAGSYTLLSGLPQIYYTMSHGIYSATSASIFAFVGDELAVIQDVMTRKFDVGFVSSNALSPLIVAGILSSGDVRVIDPHFSHDNGTVTTGVLYVPEFGVVSMPHIDYFLRDVMSDALNEVGASNPAAAASMGVVGFKVPEDYGRVTPLLFGMGILNLETGQCLWDSGTTLPNVYPLVQCPAGFYKKRFDLFASGCASSNLTCPAPSVDTTFFPNHTITKNHACVCSPCIDGRVMFNVSVGVRSGLEGGGVRNIRPCNISDTAKPCATLTARRDAFLIEVSDLLYQSRTTGATLNLQPISSVTFTITSSSLFKTTRPSTQPDGDPTVYQMFYRPREPGLQLVQVFVDGVEQVDISPVLIVVEPVKCGSGHVVSETGYCVCPKGYFDFRGVCSVVDGPRLVGLLVGLLLIVGILFFICRIIIRLRKVERIIIPQDEVFINVPYQYLGVGRDGGAVLKGVYRAQEVALKIVEPLLYKKSAGAGLATDPSGGRVSRPEQLSVNSRYLSILSHVPSFGSSSSRRDAYKSTGRASSLTKSTPPAANNDDAGAKAAAPVGDDAAPPPKVPVAVPSPIPPSTKRSARPPLAGSIANQPVMEESAFSVNGTGESLVASGLVAASSENGSQHSIFSRLLHNLLQRRGLALPTTLINVLTKLTHIRHKHIVDVYGVVISNEKPLLVMELMENGTLADLFCSNNTVDLDEDLLGSFIFGIINAVVCLHSSNLTHGNLSCRNIFVNGDLIAKVSGISVEAITGAVFTSEVQYKAPEVLCGRANTTSSDVYALGIVIYELIMRQEAFADLTREEVIRLVVEENKRPQLDSDMPNDIRGIIESCWATAPEDRPLARDLYTALQRIDFGFGRTRNRKSRQSTQISVHKAGGSYFDNFPPQMAAALTRGEKVQPTRYENCTVFISDIVSWTTLCQEMTPEESVDVLERLYSGFDRLTRRWGLFKVETIGDAYLGVSGLPDPQPDHARRAAFFALEARAFASSVPLKTSNPNGPKVNLRIGLHSGPLVGMILGSRMKKFSIYGDTVNTCSRFENLAEMNSICMSDATFSLLLLQSAPGTFHIKSRGVIQIKGKGPMTAHTLHSLSSREIRKRLAGGTRFEDPANIVKGGADDNSDEAGLEGDEEVLYLGTQRPADEIYYSRASDVE